MALAQKRSGNRSLLSGALRTYSTHTCVRWPICRSFLSCYWPFRRWKSSYRSLNEAIYVAALCNKECTVFDVHWLLFQTAHWRLLLWNSLRSLSKVLHFSHGNEEPVTQVLKTPIGTTHPVVKDLYYRGFTSTIGRSRTPVVPGSTERCAL